VAKYGQVRAQNPNPFLVPPPLNPSFFPPIQFRFLSEVSRNPMPGIQFKVSRFEYWDFSIFSTSFLYIQSRSPGLSLEDFIFSSQPLVASFFTVNQNLQTWDFCLLNPFILFHSIKVSRFESWFFYLLVSSTCLLYHWIKVSRLLILLVSLCGFESLSQDFESWNFFCVLCKPILYKKSRRIDTTKNY
jgi:hypothetical protein